MYSKEWHMIDAGVCGCGSGLVHAMLYACHAVCIGVCTSFRCRLMKHMYVKHTAIKHIGMKHYNLASSLPHLSATTLMLSLYVHTPLPPPPTP